MAEAGNPPADQQTDTGAAGALLTTKSDAPPDWRSSLPDEIKDSPGLAKFTDVASLAKGYVNAERLIGTDKIPLPKEGDAEGLMAALDRLGRPQAPDGYKIERPEGIPEEQWSDDVVNGFREVAHKAGLLPSQVNEIANWYLAGVGGQIEAGAEAAQQEAQAHITDLKKGWGAAFDEKAALAQRAVEAFGGQELKAELDRLGLSNNKHLARAFAKAGAMIQEDRPGDRGRSSFTLTPDEARREIASIQANPAYWDGLKDPAGHKVLVDRASELFKLAYPGMDEGTAA